MNTTLHTLKKLFVLVFAAFAVSVVYVANSPAQTTLLQQIADNTYNTLSAVQQILSLVQQETTRSLDSSAPDDGKNGTYSFIMNNFATLYSLSQDFANSQTGQDNFQTPLFADLIGFGSNPAALSAPYANPVLAKLPNANDLAYSTLLGKPPVANGPFDFHHYITNVSIMNIQRPIPDPIWQGKDDDKKKYANYYNSVTSIQSLNGYLLTQLKSDIEADQNPGISGLQQTLLQQVGDQNFMKQVAGESIGKVYRQILFFEAANFILNTQIQRGVRQLVAATAAQNSLMILFNIPNENQLIRNAKGLQIGT